MEAVDVNAAFWNGRNVFLTGHTGFKGGWLALWLSKLGARVTGYALAPSTSPSLFAAAGVERFLHSIIGDIRDGETLTRAMRAARPDVVVHMAAQPLVRYSYANPVETYGTNVMGTVNVLEAVRATPSARAVVVVTTDKCYDNKEWVWGYRENDELGGRDPYSSSKACTEIVAAAYRASFLNEKNGSHARIATARAGNVIGGGDWAEDRLIPDVMRAWSRGESVRIRNLESTRPWQHVLEPLRGYLTLAERIHDHGDAFAEAWNFGPEASDARPVHWVLDELSALNATAQPWTSDSDGHPHEARYLRLDCAKAAERLGWTPRWGLREALRRVVEWHGAYDEQRDMAEVSLRQIADYMSVTQ